MKGQRSSPCSLAEREGPAVSAACTLGIEARAYFGARPWAEIEPTLAECWHRNYTHLASWTRVAESAYSAWSYERPRMVLVSDPPFSGVAS